MRNAGKCGTVCWRMSKRIMVAPVAALCLLRVISQETTAQETTPAFHHAPPEVKEMKNPNAGQQPAEGAGAKLYSAHCASCHGRNAQGTGNVPGLLHGPTQSASDGELFWFITRGSVANGMPSWAKLPDPQLWQLISYVKSLNN